MRTDGLHTPLYIYSASAGAGKTYTLVRRFLLHTLCSAQWSDTPWLALQPLARTLCITFTRKATGELKERILTTLYALGREASPMLCDLSRDAGLPALEIARRARILLRALLANYSMLAVSTIDSFVQRMGTALLWELDVPHQVGTSLDLQELLNAASERLLARLERGEAAYEWLRSLAREGVQKGKGWQFQRQLAQLGRTLYQPEYAQLPPAARKAFFSIERIGHLRLHTKQAMDDLAAAATRRWSHLEARLAACGIDPETFAYGANSHWAMMRRAVEHIEAGRPFELKERIARAASQAEGWFPKSKLAAGQRAALLSLAEQHLLQPYADLARYLQEERPHYLTSLIAQERLPLLALLSTLRERIAEMSQERQTLYLSDLGTLLRDLAHEADTSFIFERMGTRYDSVLIDEFQDTSTTQWALLEPLVNESLARGGLAMLVGDVKQAIYRWRGGDWQLLATRIPARFGATFGCERIALEHNYRSRPTVVAFNNHLFQQASAAMNGLWAPLMEALPQIPAFFERGSHLLAAYLGMQAQEYGTPAQQPVSTAQDGYVEIALVEPAAASGQEDKQRSTEARIAYTLARIDYLVDELGVSPGDIAILLRRRETATQFVNALIAHGQARRKDPYSVVSQDALQLDLSPDVQLLLAALRIAARRATDVDHALLKRHIANVEHRASQLLADGPIVQPNQPPEPHAAWLAQFNTYPLLEAFDAIAQGLCLPSASHELPYVLKMRDITHARQQEGALTLQAFLSWYEQQDPSMRTLELPNDSQAINVLTIHKSKGLEFNTVLCPEVDWAISPQQGDLLWGAPLPPMPNGEKLPTVASKQALSSSLSLTALEEICLRHIDALNLLYVAFTRAKQRLCIVASAQTAKSGGTFKSFVSCALDTPMEGSQTGQFANADVLYWGVLAAQAPQTAVPEAETTRLLAVPEGKAKLYTETPLRIRRAISNTPGTSFHQMLERRRQQSIGETLHSLLAQFQSRDELHTGLQRLEAGGILRPGMAEPLLRTILDHLASEPLRACFAPDLSHWVERDLVSRTGKLMRPDRVTLMPNSTIVLDFKFAHPTSENAHQVQAYIQLLRELSYPAPRGYLWYINPHTAQSHVEPVTAE